MVSQLDDWAMGALLFEARGLILVVVLLLVVVSPQVL
jgi:hypothetical protein